VAGWPETDTARYRILTTGATDISDTELLALLLGTGIDGTQGIELARSLLHESGGLSGVLRKSVHELTRHRGIGRARVARILAALELGRRYLEAPATRLQVLRSPADAAACFKSRLAELPYEVFGCVFLDARHRVICFEPLFRGTLDGANVYPREVARRALHHNAAAIIAGHNHPSGDCEPSEADRNITLKLKNSLALLDIRLLDHLVVCRGAHLSLAERGWL
jgi:DNA repair protein RadC